MSVQFDEEPRGSNPYQQGRSGGSVPRSQQAKAYLIAISIILIIAAGIVWAKFGNPTRPTIADTRSTPSQSADSN